MTLARTIYNRHENESIINNQNTIYQRKELDNRHTQNRQLVCDGTCQYVFYGLYKNGNW